MPDKHNMVTIFALISITHAFGTDICNIKGRTEVLSMKQLPPVHLRSHQRKKASVFWVCVQQQENIKTPTCLPTSPDNDLLYSHTGSIAHYMDFGSWKGKVSAK